MGRPFILDLDDVSGQNVYICRSCYTRIAYTAMLVFPDYSPGESGLTGGLFQEVANVHRNRPSSVRNAGPHRVQDVYCNQCGDLLGREFVDVVEDLEQVVAPGEFLMIMHKLIILIVDDPPEPQQMQGQDGQQAAGQDQGQG